MSKLRIGREILRHAMDRAVLTDAERDTIGRLVTSGTGKGTVTTEVSALPDACLKTLLDDSRLSANQRAVIVMHVHGMSGGGGPQREYVYDTVVANPVEFGSTFSMLGGKSPNAEMFLNGRWYPVTLNIQFLNDNREGSHLSKGVLLHGTLSMCETAFGFNRYVYPDLFLDDGGVQRELTVMQVLNHFGYRGIQTPPGEFNLKLLRSERLARERGKVVLVSGPVVAMSQRGLPGPESRALGTPELPRKCVIEAELEVAEEQRNYYAPFGHTQDGISRLPFVRVFGLDGKGYVYVDVDDVRPYEYDAEAMGKLHLPAEMLTVLSRVFNTSVEGLFGDVIKGKHGGVVILAAGNPGVGKTLTAEVYAEQTQRPLYVLELGELGTNVQQLEENLNRVFDRVARWNAVLQFDECEIFLSQRGEDLERSAIVGSFLRLLDYYQGILFLTTNRADVLDHAVRSRVMLKLEYPDLDAAARAVIWTTMFEAAGMTITEGTIGELAEATLNGRQIRNLTRLGRILYPSGRVTLDQMRGVLRYGCA
ncbi:AAA family ATPase [Fimbriiglobus ruber]|uniref:AAA ATPase central domain protein n=1 Tax=Fimbriiglobus ruber TaxID=1908690 RepID=A0A225DQK4_9BACT|nr:ATP-binding protein [Fimbriiglobus ruber]OWK40878.1 AAA ATPase central domain protein [Fimbriiglobus ruber]